MWRPLAGLFCLALGAAGARADTRLPVSGGPGGNPFEARCPADMVLRGVDIRGGDDVDAVQPVCGRVDANNVAGPVDAFGPWRGGNGGSPQRIVCPADRPAVHIMASEAEGDATVIVNSVALWCGGADPAARPGPDNPADLRWKGPNVQSSDGVFANYTIFQPEKPQVCPPGEVGVGLHGRHGIWLDQLGLICAPYQRIAVVQRRPFGRGGPPRDPNAPPPTPIQICQAARDAQNRPTASPTLKRVLIYRCLEAYPGGALNSGNPCVQAKLIQRGQLPGDFAATLQRCFATLPP